MKGRLPKPDNYGNYWINLDHKEGPAIFPSKKLKNGEIIPNGDFFVLKNVEEGFIRQKNGMLALYSSPELAMAAI